MKERTCLKCGKAFPSESTTNRICVPCSKANRKEYQLPSVNTKFSGRVLPKPNTEV